jgi:hypothetical protein
MRIFWLSFFGLKIPHPSRAENFERINRWAESPGLRPPTDYIRDDGSIRATNGNRSSRRSPGVEANNRK